MNPEASYRISPDLRVDILQSTWKVDEEEINVFQAPSFILGLRHRHRMLSLVVVVP